MRSGSITPSNTRPSMSGATAPRRRSIHGEWKRSNKSSKASRQHGVGNLAPPLALQRVRLEETAVEEWDSPEAAARPPRFGATIERAEEERLKQIAVQPAATRPDNVDGLAEEVWLPVEPSFGTARSRGRGPG